MQPYRCMAWEAWVVFFLVYSSKLRRWASFFSRRLEVLAKLKMSQTKHQCLLLHFSFFCWKQATHSCSRWKDKEEKKDKEKEREKSSIVASTLESSLQHPSKVFFSLLWSNPQTLSCFNLRPRSLIILPCSSNPRNCWIHAYRWICKVLKYATKLSVTIRLPEYSKYKLYGQKDS